MLAVHRSPTRWVATPADLEAAVEDLKRFDVVGLDIETRLDFETPCLIQVACGPVTYLIDAIAVRDLSPLADVLETAIPVKVIHNASFERHVLAQIDIELDAVFDTLTASRDRYGAGVSHSLAAVCGRELGLQVDKRMQTSDWSRRPLSPEQLAYAAVDVEVLLDLYNVFRGS